MLSWEQWYISSQATDLFSCLGMMLCYGQHILDIWCKPVRLFFTLRRTGAWFLSTGLELRSSLWLKGLLSFKATPCPTYREWVMRLRCSWPQHGYDSWLLMGTSYKSILSDLDWIPVAGTGILLLVCQVELFWSLQGCTLPVNKISFPLFGSKCRTRHAKNVSLQFFQKMQIKHPNRDLTGMPAAMKPGHAGECKLINSCCRCITALL